MPPDPPIPPPGDSRGGRTREQPERDAFGNPVQPGWGSTGSAPPPPPPGQPPPPVPAYAPPAAAVPTGPPETFAGHTLASWGSRAGAWLVDLLLVLAAWVPVVLAFVAERNAAGGILLLLAVVWMYFGYAPLFMMRSGARNGQTPGKQIVGIRVVREGGEPLAYGYSLLRELAVKQLLIGLVGGFFLYLPTLLNYLWPLWDDQNRALHDMVSQTRVVEA